MRNLRPLLHFALCCGCCVTSFRPHAATSSPSSGQRHRQQLLKNSFFNGETEALAEEELQRYLRADIQRRCTELILLGWLGRCYCAAPFIFDQLFPDVFRLVPYSSSAAACFRRPQGVVDVVLKEGSIGGAKGIPFRLRIATVRSESAAKDAEAVRIESAELLSIGCDLRRAPQETDPRDVEDEEEVVWTRMNDGEVARLCADINDGVDAAVNKRRVVETITRAIFSKLSPVGAAVRAGRRLDTCGPPSFFRPREEVWGLEGTSEKWLQQVSGYFFAASTLQDVRFAAAPLTESDEYAVFTFYLDATEPLNSDDPTRIYNPEVINCAFL